MYLPLVEKSDQLSSQNVEVGQALISSNGFFASAFDLLPEAIKNTLTQRTQENIQERLVSKNKR